MSEYTPTTEEVRDYIRAADRVTAHMFAGSADSVEAFDRWLAAHDAEVRAAAIEGAAVIADRYATAPGRQTVSVESIAARDIAARIRRDAEERAGVVAEEPEWESETIQYGHLLDIGVFIVEPRGKNYSTYQRRVKLGRPESSWVPVEQGEGS